MPRESGERGLFKYKDAALHKRKKTISLQHHLKPLSIVLSLLPSCESTSTNGEESENEHTPREIAQNARVKRPMRRGF